MAFKFSFPFSSSAPKSFLGIDIGTTSVKIVELAKERGGTRLKTYGELKAYGYIERLSDPIQTSSLQMLDSDAASMVRLVMDEAQVHTNVATISIPVFSSFFTLLELPLMPEKELQGAIPFQAKQLVPVPISEVALEWEIVGRVGQAHSGEMAQEKLLVLVVAVPKEVVEKYARIARLAGVEVLGLEPETFSLVRSLLPREQRPSAIIDLGGRTTNITVLDEGSIRMAHSVDTSGAELTRVIASALGVSTRRAEALKLQRGLRSDDAEGEIAKVLRPVVDLIMGEVEKVCNVYWRKYGRKVEHYVLAGGGAGLPGLLDYLKERWGGQVVIGESFQDISYPKELSATVKELGSSFAVAAGLAMRQLGTA